MKPLIGIILAVALFGAGWYANDYFKAHPVKDGANQPQQQQENGSASQPCAQVITSAVNTATGDIKEFPTPCDVPKGWEVIQNDIPGMDLQPQ